MVLNKLTGSGIGGRLSNISSASCIWLTNRGIVVDRYMGEGIGGRQFDAKQKNSVDGGQSEGIELFLNAYYSSQSAHLPCDCGGRVQGGAIQLGPALEANRKWIFYDGSEYTKTRHNDAVLPASFAYFISGK